MRNETTKAIETSKEYLRQGCPKMAVFVLRDLQDTQDKDLAELAWAMYKDNYITPNDVLGLIEMLES